MTDDPLFSSPAFLTANDVVVTFKFLPLFLYQLRLKEVILHDAVISIIRDSAGVYNFSSLGPENTRRQSPEKSVTSDGPTRGFSPALIPSSLIQIINATLHFIDQTNGSNLTVNRFDLKATDFDHENSFEFELAMAVFATEQNLKIRAVVGPLKTMKALKICRSTASCVLINSIWANSELPCLSLSNCPWPWTFAVFIRARVSDLKGLLTGPRYRGQVDGMDASFRFD